MDFTKQLLKVWQRRYLKIKKWMVFDVETTGLNPRKCEIFSYCLCDQDGNVEIYRLDGTDKVKIKKGWERLQEVFADKTIGKIAHNFKFEFHYLEKHNIKIHPETVWIDTMLMSRMMRNLHFGHGLDVLGHEILEYTINTPYGKFNSLEIDTKVKKQAEARGMRFDLVEHELMYWYQYADAERPMLLFLCWWDDFKSNGPFLRELIVETLVVITSQRMEKTGMTVHNGNCKKLIHWMDKELDTVTDESFLHFGEYVNLNSDKVVARLLFKKLGLPHVKFSPKTGEPLTDKDVLFALKAAHPKEQVIDWIIKTRSYTNGITTLQSYLSLQEEKNLIHANVNSCQAKTRRQSSSNPNMQNVQKASGLKNPYPVPARKCLKCKPGYVTYFVDYAAIELRLIAELAQSHKIIELFKQGISPHHYACKIFFGDKFRNKDLDYDLYNAGKNTHFCIGYGGGNAKKVSVVSGLPLDIAGVAVANYKEAVPEIAFLCNNIGKKVREIGYIVTPFGSKLCVPIKKGYMGLNYLIQCTAALILKRAEVNVDHYFKTIWSDDIKLNMVVHDEIIMEVPKCKEKFMDEIIYTSSKLMTDMPEITVPLEVEWSRSPNVWNSKKSLPTVKPTSSLDIKLNKSILTMLQAA